MDAAWDGNDREEPFRVRSTSCVDDAAGTHNELRSHGRCRCLVVSQAPVARLPNRYLPERVKKCRKSGRPSATQQLTKAGCLPENQRISKRKFGLPKRNPMVAVVPQAIFS